VTDAACPTPISDGAVRRIVAASGSSFMIGMRVLPTERRRAIFALYAFCRIVDDIADGPGEPGPKLMRLDRWAGEIERVFAGAPRTPVGVELAWAAHRYALPRAELDLILDGMRMDAVGIVAPDPSVLERYLRRVAGTVGILSMRVFGAWRGERSQRFALSLARAVQLTNILRDVEEDAALGRLYLPAPLLAAVGLPADPTAVPGHPALPEARRRLGQAARSHFRRAEADVRAHDRLRLAPALLMMGPYERLLRRMEADWTRPPARRPGWLKVLDGARCAARGFATR
jgi:presqualene diphosphate synthase